VHVPVIEPQTDLMWMVHPLARARLEGPAARHQYARRGPYRVEGRLLERGGIDVRRERFAVDEDVDPAQVVVRHDLDLHSLTLSPGPHPLAPSTLRGEGVQKRDAQQQK